ncbi:MAG: dihydrodipicolinate synthase family protein [Saprospiraceae bacterium]|nr:dihydrodipicolinate synthase family protein [Saprospiraceae bacterium]
MAKPNWTGVYPALLTQFDAQENLDLEVFGHNLKAQIDAGVEGVIIGGTLGEASTIEESEILAMLSYSKEQIPSDIPVIINVAEGSTRRAIATAQKMEQNGADGIMLLPPMRYVSDEDETITFYSTVASNTSLPILVYNNPVNYGVKVTISMFEQLAKHDNIQAVKESTHDVSNVTRMKNAFGDRFKILCGVDTLTMEELALGADGLVAGLVDAFPAETVAIYKLMKAGRYGEALEIYRWFLPLLELDIVSKLVQYIKLAAVKTGLGNEYVRAPRKMISGEERSRILQIIENGIATRPTLPDYKNI